MGSESQELENRLIPSPDHLSQIEDQNSEMSEKINIEAEK